MECSFRYSPAQFVFAILELLQGLANAVIRCSSSMENEVSMSFVQLVSALRNRRADTRSSIPNEAIALFYVLLLGCVSLHVYRTPVYSFDSLQYMGNAVLMEERDPVVIHQRVYSEIDGRIPRIARENMLGHEVGAPEDQNKSLQERAANPYRFAEFLPLFAIRPMYNILLFFVAKSGLGLLRAGIVLSTLSHFLLGILLFRWLTRHVTPFVATVVSLLAMISPPIMNLGRENTSDGVATVIALSAIYVIFETERILIGTTLLLASIYFRTDFVVLAGPVLLMMWLGRKGELWKAGFLAGMAICSVLVINHFAGDYGIKMLYYRNFVGAPSAPGEMVVQFSVQDYLFAFRAGITRVLNSFFVPFLLLGVVGASLGSKLRTVAVVTFAYVGLHFVILPNWDERWFGVFYFATVLCAATVSNGKKRPFESGDAFGSVNV